MTPRAGGGSPARVLHVALSLNPGGTERLVVELARRLHPQMPAAVCCLDETGAWAGELHAEDIVVTALERAPGFRPSLGAGVAAAARAHRATVIHAHHYSPFVYSCLARLRHPRLGLVFTEHGRLSDAPPSPRRRLANRLLARCPSDVVTVSGDLKAHLVGEGFPDAAVRVIYNGIDVGPAPTVADRLAVRDALGVPAGQFVVGTVARLDPVKDLGTLLQAVDRVPRDVALWVVGDGPERASLETLRTTLTHPSRIRFLGQRQDARRLLAGCDVYVNCSISEGVSLTILEAMAAGLPIVATAVGGTPEVLDASSGCLVPARRDDRLAAELEGLADDADRRARLGAGARARVEARFTLDRMVREYAELYARASRRGAVRTPAAGAGVEAKRTRHATERTN